MKKIISSLSVILFLGSFSLYAQNLDKILDSYYDAIGMSTLLKTKTIAMKGKILQSDMELPMEMYQKRPNKLRMEAEIQGAKFIQVFDGKDGWAVMPWTGSTEPQSLNDDQIKNIKQMADFEGDLYNWKEKGYDVTLEGEEDMEGTPVYKIKLLKPDGDQFIYYLDKDNFVVLKVDAKIKVQGTPVEGSTFFSNFKTIDSMIMPFSIESRVNGKVVSQIEIDSIDVNKDIDDAIFEKPLSDKQIAKP